MCGSERTIHHSCGDTEKISGSCGILYCWAVYEPIDPWYRPEPIEVTVNSKCRSCARISMHEAEFRASLARIRAYDRLVRKGERTWLNDPKQLVKVNTARFEKAYRYYRWELKKCYGREIESNSGEQRVKRIMDEHNGLHRLDVMVEVRRGYREAVQHIKGGMDV